jgi:hypothetical protein
MAHIMPYFLSARHSIFSPSGAKAFGATICDGIVFLSTQSTSLQNTPPLAEIRQII